MCETTVNTKPLSGFKSIICKAKNKDGSFSLYDNDRFRDRDSWHEQILAVTPSKGDFGLGSVQIDFYTGGWENEYVDFSLVDIGHAEAGLEIKDGQLYVAALASAWSPSFSFTIYNVTIELGVEALAIGGNFKLGGSSFDVSVAGGIGPSVSVDWGD